METAAVVPPISPSNVFEEPFEDRPGEDLPLRCRG